MIAILSPPDNKPIKTLRNWPGGNPLQGGPPIAPTFNPPDSLTQDTPGLANMTLLFEHAGKTDQRLASTFEAQEAVFGVESWSGAGTIAWNVGIFHYLTFGSAPDVMEARVRAKRKGMNSPWSDPPTDPVLLL